MFVEIILLLTKLCHIACDRTPVDRSFFFIFISTRKTLRLYGLKCGILAFDWNEHLMFNVPILYIHCYLQRCIHKWTLITSILSLNFLLSKLLLETKKQAEVTGGQICRP